MKDAKKKNNLQFNKITKQHMNSYQMKLIIAN